MTGLLKWTWETSKNASIFMVMFLVATVGVVKACGDAPQKFEDFFSRNTATVTRIDSLGTGGPVRDKSLRWQFKLQGGRALIDAWTTSEKKYRRFDFNLDAKSLELKIKKPGLLKRLLRIKKRSMYLLGNDQFGLPTKLGLKFPANEQDEVFAELRALLGKTREACRNSGDEGKIKVVSRAPIAPKNEQAKTLISDAISEGEVLSIKESLANHPATLSVLYGVNMLQTMSPQDLRWEMDVRDCHLLVDGKSAADNLVNVYQYDFDLVDGNVRLEDGPNGTGNTFFLAGMDQNGLPTRLQMDFGADGDRATGFKRSFKKAKDECSKSQRSLSAAQDRKDCSTDLSGEKHEANLNVLPKDAFGSTSVLTKKRPAIFRSVKKLLFR